MGDQLAEIEHINWQHYGPIAQSAVQWLIEDDKRLRGLLAEALDYLEAHRDEGPRGEQWQSEQLMDLIYRIDPTSVFGKPLDSTAAPAKPR